MSIKGRVHLFAGDDEFAVRTTAGELMDSLVPESDRAFGLEVVEGQVEKKEEVFASIKRCEEAFLTPGFLMTGAKVVWWRDVLFLSEGQTAQSEDVKNRIKGFAQMLREMEGEGNILIITTPKVDRRSLFFKVCSERFTVREFLVPEKSADAGRYAQSVLQHELASHGLRADSEALLRFLARVGVDSRQIVNEVEKLSLYVQGRKEVTVEDVDAIVSPSAESAMWDIQDAVGQRQFGKSLQVLRNLLEQRESPIGIVTMILGRLKDLQVYREALDQGWLRLKSGGRMAEWGQMEPGVEEQLTHVLKRNPRSLHPFRVGMLAQQAQLYSPAMIRRAQQQVMAVQEALVSSSVPAAVQVELLLARLLADGTAGAGVRAAGGRTGSPTR